MPRLFTPHFTLIFAITFITFFAAFQLFPTVPLRLIELGATVGQSGRFMTVFTMGSSFGALFMGPLGDRIGQRRMVVGSSALFALLVASYGLVQGPWWWICVLALPHGVVWSGLLTATMATLGGVLPGDRRADGLAIYGLASPGGVVFGPMLGLAVFHHFGFRAITLSLGLGFLALSLLAFSLPADSPHRERRSPFQKPERIMVAPCAVLFATALGYGVLGTFTAQEALRLNLLMPSAFLTFMAVGMVAMRIAMSRWGFGSHPVRLIPRMLWMTCAGLLILALAPTGTPRHIAAALLYGSGYSMVHTLVNAYVLDVVHAERRGAAFGATLFSFDVGIGLGAFSIGGLIGWADVHFGVAGFRLGWLAAALFSLAAVPLSHRLVRKAR